MASGPFATAAAKSPPLCSSLSQPLPELWDYAWTLAAKMRNKLIHALNGNGGGGARTTQRKRAEKERASAGVNLNENMFSQLLQLLSLLQSLLSQFGQCNQSGCKNQRIGS